MLHSVVPIRAQRSQRQRYRKCVAVRCASGLNWIDEVRKTGLTKPTSYRPPSTATILDSQVVEAEEVIDMEPAMLLECRR